MTVIPQEVNGGGAERAPATSHLHPRVVNDSEPLELISRLCEALDRQSLNYCHWKSNEAIGRSARGDNDLDLLVGARDADRFLRILHDLRFVRAEIPAERRSAGVDDYYGLDETGKLVHVHAHYRLVLGDDTTKNYRMPIEEAYLDSATPQGFFRIPSPEFEYVVFIVRMVLKHATTDAIVSLKGSLSESERREHQFLLERIRPDEVNEILNAHVPFIDAGLFQRSERSLSTATSIGFRTKAAAELQRRLGPWAGRPQPADAVLRLWRRVYWRVLRYVLKRPPRRRLSAGGKLIAIVGGDGAGKSSAVEGVCSWLSQVFVVDKVHLGKPPRSPLTTLVRIARVARRLTRKRLLSKPAASSARVVQLPERPLDLLWNSLIARDRYRAYLRARRVVEDGGIAVCDRYPVPEISFMDGPRSSSQLLPTTRLTGMTRRLVELERSWYERLDVPDILIVLRVDPEIAVQRRGDEDADFVRARCTEVWNLAWEATEAVVIDANRPKADVLAEVKSAIWRRF